MTINLTPAASERMRGFLEHSPNAIGIRFGVKRTGCSGFAYVVELTEARHEEDEVVEIDGLRLFIDNKSKMLVDGTSIDFQRQGLNAGFIYHNPNVTGQCGCGESFTVS